MAGNARGRYGPITMGTCEIMQVADFYSECLTLPQTLYEKGMQGRCSQLLSHALEVLFFTLPRSCDLKARALQWVGIGPTLIRNSWENVICKAVPRSTTSITSLINLMRLSHSFPCDSFDRRGKKTCIRGLDLSTGPARFIVWVTLEHLDIQRNHRYFGVYL